MDRLSHQDRDSLLQRYKPEFEHVSVVMDGSELKCQLDFDRPEVIIRPDLSVTRADYAYEIIGSLREQSLAEIIAQYREPTVRERRMAGWEYRDLAAQFGDQNGTKLYTPYGMWIKWIEKMFRTPA